MSYFDGFVLAVPTANKDRFIAHANTADPVFHEQGAARIVEAWGDDVPKGTVTDFQGAVQATDDETVVFSWMEWPDKPTRDAAMAKMDDLMKDERLDAGKNPMPFDGKRMIYGGFAPLLDERNGSPGTYADGFVLPVPAANKDAYLKMARDAWANFKKHGATRLVEAWGDDVPDGKVTDYRRAVKAEEGETVVFSFIEWPNKATRDAAWAKMMADESMKPDGDMPFDGKRMFWGGFQPVVTIGG